MHPIFIARADAAHREVQTVRIEIISAFPFLILGRDEDADVVRGLYFDESGFNKYSFDRRYHPIVRLEDGTMWNY